MSHSTPEADKPQRPHNQDPEPTRYVIPTSIVVFFVLLFWPIFFGKLMVGGDALYYSYPLRAHAWQIIKHGSLPLWTSSLFAGYPLFSMSQLGLAYPLTWGYAMLPAIWAEQLYVALPFLLCPVFSYFYLRQVGRSRNGSLLGALSFTYGGLFIQTINGYFNHGTMWFPLILLGIESTRKGRLYQSLPIIVGAYAMAILNGQAQAFFYVGVFALLYSLFISFYIPTPTRKWFFPLIATFGGLLLATGLTAFQTLESWWAVSSSIREGLSYPTFVEGSLSAGSVFTSVIASRFNVEEVMAYVPGLTACLAVLALVTYTLGKRHRDRRALFWGAIAALSILLMLGGNTPIYRFLYHIPIFNLFRVPARHAFEWTFAVSALGAYGWDALPKLHSNRTVARGLANIAVVGLFVLFLATAAYWMTFGPTLSEQSYTMVKVAFTLEILIIVWTLFSVPISISRHLLTLVVFIACFVEASILFGVIWKPSANYVASYQRPSAATQFLRQLPEGRVYTDGPHVSQRFDSFNMLLPYQVANVAGYEPALLNRFSEALGNVGPDTSAIRSGFKSDGSLFEPGNQVLDLLNTRYVTAFSDLRDKHDESTSVDGVDFAESVAPIKIVPSQSVSLGRLNLVGNTLKVVSSLAYAQAVAQNQPVGTLKVYFGNGEMYEAQLLAGVHTAEWAHERPDVRSSIPHELAPIFDSAPGDDKNSFRAYRYLASLPLNQRNELTRIEIINTSAVHISLWKLSVFDSTTKTSIPIPLMTTKQWDRLYQNDGVIVLGNKHARPRAWLVSKTELVTGSEALETIRGRASMKLPLGDVALVEDPSAVIGPGSVEGNTIAKVVPADSNRLVVETDAPNETFLVVSDVYYPGWIASVDGKDTEIYRANYLLRGVRIPPGRHRVEMRYTAPGARRGLIVSVLSLAIFIAVSATSVRTRL